MERVSIIDTEGNAKQVRIYDNQISVINQTYLQAICERCVPGRAPWAKLGYLAASAATESVLWSGGSDYVFPAAAQQMEVVSSSANDAAAGTGARTVRISYLTADFTEKTETITLNGATAVPTVATDIYRINAFRVLTTGTGAKAAGNIQLRALADTPIYSYIVAGQTAARTLVFTVPKGKTLYVTNLFFSSGASTSGKRVTFTTRGTYEPLTDTINTAGIFYPYTETSVVDQAIALDLQMPSRFITGTDLKISAAGESGAICTAQARGWIETAD